MENNAANNDCAVTGKGIYVTYDHAMNIIDNSSYTKNKKVRLKKVIEAVAKNME